MIEGLCDPVIELLEVGDVVGDPLPVPVSDEVREGLALFDSDREELIEELEVGDVVGDPLPVPVSDEVTEGLALFDSDREELIE